MAPETTIDDDEIDISQIVKTLWNGKWLIILISIITGGLGVAYAFMATPIYQGNALLQIEAKSGGASGLSGLTEGLSLGGGSATSTELELLKSRKVVRPTVERFHLDIVAKPITFPMIGGYVYRKFGQNNGISQAFLGEYFGFFENYAWGGEKINVSQFDVPESLYEEIFNVILLADLQYRLELRGVEIFKGEIGKKYHIESQNIDILIGKLEGRVGASFDLVHRDPILAVNDLIEDILVAESGKTSGIVEISLQGEDRAQIKQIITHILTTYQQQNIEYNNVEANDNLNFVANQLPEAAEKVELAETKIYEYKRVNNTIDLNQKTQQLLKKLLDIEGQLNELKLGESELLRKFKPEHPLYKDFLRKQGDLEEKKKEIELETSKIPTEQFEVFKLQRDVELSEKIYLQLLNRHEGLKIIQAGTSGSIRVIDDTIVHPKAVKPQKMIVVIVSTFIGIIIAMAYLLVRSMVGNKIENVEQLKGLGFKIYALVGESVSQKKFDRLDAKRGELRILAELKSEDLAVEALRGLRTNLCFTVAEADNNVIMITGASPSVGKSFVAQNLAALLAQTGKKTLLVDVDLRRGKLHEAFGMDVAPGLVDYLSGDVEFTEVCRETRIKNLDIITCGQKSSCPSELLMSEKFTELCTKYQQDYDFIILDTSPILAVTDAAIVGKLAATSIMVVRQGVSQLKEVELATQRLTLTGIDVTGYVFNGADKNQYEYSY